MATQNNGRPRFARHGGKLEIGADEYVNITRAVEYSIEFVQDEMLEDASMNYGVPIAATLRGDTGKAIFRIKPRYAMNVADAASIISLFHGSTAGASKTATIKWTVFDYLGATTGESHTFANAELMNNPVLSGSGGTEADAFELVFRGDASKPTSAAVGA